MRRVFISYSGRDLVAAQALKHLLQIHGWEAWIERHELKPGENFPEKITGALRESVAVVTIWSDNSVDSAWVHHETSYAIGCTTPRPPPTRSSTTSPPPRTSRTR
jgi:hypothetical protein